MRGQKTGGRVKGTPNKATAEAKRVCQALLKDPEYRKAFKARWQAGDLPPAVECMIWHYAYGKPTETLEHTGEGGGPIDHRVTFEFVA